MKKLMFAIFALLVGFAVPVSGAQAFDVKAGPIWSNSDAHNKCPGTCEYYGGWGGGSWTTTVWGKMSVCGCGEAPQGGPNDANAGPIWNNDHAKQACTKACYWYGGWNGQWRTTTPGVMSVCGCKETVKG